MNTSEQQTLGTAVGLTVARCTIGNVSGGNLDDAQITSDLHAFVSMYKQVGGQATLGGSSSTTLAAEAQQMTSQLSCAPALSQILVSGTSSVSGGTATAAPTAADPQAKAACTSISACGSSDPGSKAEGRQIEQKLQAGWDQYKFQDEPIMAEQLAAFINMKPTLTQVGAIEAAFLYARRLISEQRLVPGDDTRLVQAMERKFPAMKQIPIG